jgi:hypothetical protein
VAWDKKSCTDQYDIALLSFIRKTVPSCEGDTREEEK